MTRILIHARYATFLAVSLALAWLMVFGQKVKYEQSLQSFFAQDDPVVLDYQRASDLFGNDNLVFVSYEDPDLLTPEGLARVAELAGEVAPGRIEAVVGVQSLDAMPQFWRIDDELVRIEGLPGFLREGAKRLLRAAISNVDPSAIGALTIRGAIEAADPAGLPALREAITGHPLLQGTVVDATGTSTAIVVQLAPMEDQEPRETIAALRAAADTFADRHGLERPALVGPPVLLADGFEAVDKDGQRLSIVGMALIGLVTLLATRSLWWSVVPILAGWAVWLGAEHVLGSLGLRLSLSGGPLVAQIIVLTMPAASHLAIHFRDDLRQQFDRRGAAVETILSVSRPILWTAATGAVGYAALVSSNVVPVRQFGAILAVCTVLASLLTLALSPIAMLPPFRLEIPVKPGSISVVDRALRGITHAVVRHPTPIVLAVVAVVLPLAWGMPRLELETNYINAFKPGSRVLEDYHVIERRLGGIGLVSVVVPMEQPIDMAGLARFRELDREIEAIGEDTSGPDPISRVISLATVLDPQGKLASLAPERAEDALALKLELINASPQGTLLRSFWNPSEGWARSVVRIPENQPAGLKGQSIERAGLEAGRLFGDPSFVTGMSYLLTQTTRGVMSTQWNAFGWALGGILLMTTLAFRRLSLALLAIFPSLLAVGLVLGLMGWQGIKLDLATALIASVALGLSVDDTFHCLLQYRRYRDQGVPFRESLFASYSVTGLGVLLSSLAVGIGFTVLRFSEFVPFSNFGTLVAIATLGSSLGNLVLLPACLALRQKLTGRDSAPLRAAPQVAVSNATVENADPRGDITM